jgi:hypothetical protein
MISSASDKDAYNRVKDQYENESLTDLVTNKNGMKKILEYDGELIQKADPIYMDPGKDDQVSAHFYAPRKNVFGKYYDTFWVNLWVVWIISILLAFTLYFDLLKKLLEFFEHLFGRLSKKSTI